MSTIENEWEYKTSWLTLILCSVFTILMMIVMSFIVSSTNVTPSNNASVRMVQTGGWLITHGLFIFSLIAVTVVYGFLIYKRLKFKSRVALSSDALILPAKIWSRQEQEIPYASIYDTNTETLGPRIWLHIYHKGGKHWIINNMLPAGAFEEIQKRITAEVERNNHKA